MLIIDGHLDLSWNALQWNRDLLLSTYTLRTREVGVAGRGRAQNTVAFPEMRQGRIAVSFATLLARATGIPVPYLDYHSTAQAYGVAHGQLAYYRALEKGGHVRVLTESQALHQHIVEWEKWEQDGAVQTTCPPLGMVISMEGADPIQTPGELAEWHAAGLRLLGLAHYGPCRYAGGTGTETGLTEIGRQLLKEIERLGIVVDLTHCSDQAVDEVLHLYSGPVLASHQNCRTLVPHQRQFTDSQLRAVIERDGVIGAAFDAWMLKPGWVLDQTSNSDVTLATVVNHIDYVCQLAGNAQHAALGTDLDGGFGRDQSPCDLDTIADLQKIADLLAGRGYKEAEIKAIMYGNWIRLLDKALS